MFGVADDVVRHRSHVRVEKGRLLFLFPDKDTAEVITPENLVTNLSQIRKFVVVDRNEDRTVVNLASKEYFKSVQPKKLAGPLVTPVFKDVKDGKARFLSFFAKATRGAMARWAIQNRLSTADQLRTFDGGGYVLQPELSNETHLEFHRPRE